MDIRTTVPVLLLLPCPPSLFPESDPTSPRVCAFSSREHINVWDTDAEQTFAGEVRIHLSRLRSSPAETFATQAAKCGREREKEDA